MSFLAKIMWRELEYMDEGVRPDEYLIKRLAHLVTPAMTPRFIRTMRAVIEAYYANYY